MKRLGGWLMSFAFGSRTAGGSSPTAIYQKDLTESDLPSHACRALFCVRRVILGE